MNQLETEDFKNTFKDAKQLYLAHRNSATKPTKIENLDKLWETLINIYNEGGRDYSLAEVGRRLEVINGPKTQSLRNSQGVYYRDIITAFAHTTSGSTRYISKTKSNIEQALDHITDPSVKAVIKIALDEAKRLKVVNDNLHAAFKSLQIGTTLAQPNIQTIVEPLPVANKSVLSLQMIQALTKGIDKTRLAQQGLCIAEDDSIENEHGDKIFPPSFVYAIQTVLNIM